MRHGSSLFAARRPWTAALALLLPFLFAIVPASADTFGGRAFAAHVSVPTLGVAPVSLADSGELAPDGGWDGAGLAGAALPGVFRASVLNSVTSGGSGRAESAASLADVAVLPGHPARLSASFVMAEAAATGAGAIGVTRVDGLTFGGMPVQVTGLPNQTVSLPMIATLFINEQRRTSTGGVQSVTVNALRLVLVTGEQVVLAGARSVVDPAGSTTAAATRGSSGRCGATGAAAVPAVHRGPRPTVLPAHAEPECFDFVTGGGWFEPRFEGGPPKRVNFGFNAGYRSPGGPLLGHFNLVDHNDGTHVKGTSVDSYFPLDRAEDPCRMFGGEATFNDAGGYRYFVEVCDYGEPGRDDRIRVLVYGPDRSEVYFADDRDSAKICDAGEPRCGDLDGGNLQLHKPCREQRAATTAPAAPAARRRGRAAV